MPQAALSVTQGRLPRLGLGTFGMQGADCQAAVESALALGYRHIDTAAMYGNEAAVGAALAACGLKRDELFVTTKVWHDQLTPQRLRRSLERSVQQLALDCVDLFLIHWPAPGMALGETLEALMRLGEEASVRALGAANFPLPLLKEAIEKHGARLICNQVEYHVFLDQSALLDYQRSKQVDLVAYCPLARGEVMQSRELQAIGRKHACTPAQVALAWLLGQDNVAAIPKARRRTSQQANIEALRIRLDDQDKKTIAGLRKDRRLVNPTYAPAWDAGQPAT